MPAPEVSKAGAPILQTEGDLHMDQGSPQGPNSTSKSAGDLLEMHNLGPHPTPGPSGSEPLQVGPRICAHELPRGSAAAQA